MDSSVTKVIELGVPPQFASAAVLRVIEENKYRLASSSDDGSAIEFFTKKTMLSWELEVKVAISSGPTGSTVRMDLDTAGNRPAAMMDGKKNKKSADKLEGLITAAAQ